MDPDSKPLSNGSPTKDKDRLLLRRSPPASLYRECMRNHAASLGAHAVDGCGEFMPSLSSPLFCAACGCHRNFHRRLLQQSAAGESSSGDDEPEQPSAPHMLMALSARPTAAVVAPRKRFRTKFSSEQKERMLSLSETLGWRMQRKDEVVIEDGCREIGVDKGVFKVWMHNNKHHFYGTQRRGGHLNNGAAGGGGGGGVGGDDVLNGSCSSS